MNKDIDLYFLLNSIQEDYMPISDAVEDLIDMKIDEEECIEKCGETLQELLYKLNINQKIRSYRNLHTQVYEHTNEGGMQPTYEEEREWIANRILKHLKTKDRLEVILEEVSFQRLVLFISDWLTNFSKLSGSCNGDNGPIETYVHIMQEILREVLKEHGAGLNENNRIINGKEEKERNLRKHDDSAVFANGSVLLLNELGIIDLINEQYKSKTDVYFIISEITGHSSASIKKYVGHILSNGRAKGTLNPKTKPAIVYLDKIISKVK